MENLTSITFKEKVFDYENEKTWKFLGDKPTIIDFWAQYCQPCHKLSPILEQLSKDYDGQINIYKVDTEQEDELSAVFQIRSIPTMLFIPMKGQPQLANGFMPKDKLIEIISDVLKVK